MMFDEGKEPDGQARPQGLKTPPPPRRFYTLARCEAGADGYVVLLDGKPALTPGKKRLVLPRQDLAEIVASEWQAQGEFIRALSMPLTRLANAAIDGVTGQETPVRAEIVKYAGSDLICYRADEPDSLVARQAAAWDPILARFHQVLGASFTVQTGIVFARQPPEALQALADAVEAYAGLDLAALHVMTTISGSALIALAVARGWLEVEAAFDAASIDEDWNQERWGADEEAAARRAQRRLDMLAAGRVFAP